MTRLCTVLCFCLTLSGLAGAGELDTFVFDVEGLVRYESGHAVKESLQSFAHVQFVEVDLRAKQVTVGATAGKYAAKRLLQAINSTGDGSGPMNAKLHKIDKPQPLPGTVSTKCLDSRAGAAHAQP